MIFLFTRKHMSQWKIKTQTISFIPPHIGHRMLQVSFREEAEKKLPQLNWSVATQLVSSWALMEDKVLKLGRSVENSFTTFQAGAREVNFLKTWGDTDKMVQVKLSLKRNVWSPRPFFYLPLWAESAQSISETEDPCGGQTLGTGILHGNWVPLFSLGWLI